MSSSFKLYLLADTRLQIVLVEDEDDGAFHQNRNGPQMYRITGPPELVHLAGGDKSLLTGWMSPIHRVSLPEGVKLKAGIPAAAMHFAYTHPLPQLAKRVDWKKLENDLSTSFRTNASNNLNNKDSSTAPGGSQDSQNGSGTTEEVRHEQGSMRKKTSDLSSSSNNNNNKKAEDMLIWSQTILLGGYAYFDADSRFLRTNTLSFSPTSYELRLTGPLAPSQSVIDDMERLRRMHNITLGVLHEVGFVAAGWVHPAETFHDDIPATSNDRYVHGGFLYRKDSGSHLLYMVDPQARTTHIDKLESSDVGGSSLRDAMLQYQRKLSRDENSTLRSQLFQLDTNFLATHGNNIDEWNTGTRTNLKRSFVGTQSDDDKIISAVMKLSQVYEDPRLSDDYKILMARRFHDEFKFHITLLHWVCQLKAPTSFIRTLIGLDENKVSVDVRDQAGWLPLHHACRFSPDNEELVELLLEADGRHQSVWKRDHLNRCPLHIACDSPDVSVGVIRQLLEADTQNKTIMEKSRFLGWLPLHFACANKTSGAVVTELLERDTLGVSVRTRSQDGLYPIHLALRRNAGADVIRALLEKDTTGTTIMNRAESHSLLPIHIACAIGSPPDVVELLLSKDERGLTIYDEVQEQGADAADSPMYSRLTKGMIPLHVACGARNPNYGVIVLLLEADDSDKFTLTKTDSFQRLPLHIALSHTVGANIVKEMLSYQKEAQIRHEDDEQSYPIHYACRYGCSADVIELLLQTDELFHSYEKQGALPTILKRDSFGRRPIFYAVRNDLPAESIAVLLEGDRFSLKGLDPKQLRRFGDQVSMSVVLQERINSRSSERAFVGLLLGELYVNVIMVIILMSATEQFVHGSRVEDWETSFLFFCGVYFFARELLRAQQLWRFLTDFWSLVDVGRMVSVLLAASHMRTVTYTQSRLSLNILLCAGNFVIVGFILFLRSTFLPFAKFVGGILEILKTLVIFLITSGFVLLAFAFSFFVEACHQGRCDPNGPNNDDETGNIPSLLDSFSQVLLSFFSGPNNVQSSTEVLFGVLAIVVLLNVVIAIVSNAWDRTSAEVSRVFWEFRLYFLADTDDFADFFKATVRPLRRTPPGEAVWGFVEWVDRKHAVRLRDNVNWSMPPFNEITSYEQYIEPERFFPVAEVKELGDLRSLQADLKWLGSHRRWQKFVVVVTWVVHVFQYVLLVALGIPTFGYTWPRGLRTFFIGSNYHDANNLVTDAEKIEQLQETMSHILRELSEAKKKNNGHDDHGSGDASSSEWQETSGGDLRTLDKKLDHIMRALEGRSETKLDEILEDASVNIEAESTQGTPGGVRRLPQRQASMGISSMSTAERESSLLLSQQRR